MVPILVSVTYQCCCDPPNTLMEDTLKKELGYSSVTCHGSGGGGAISSGQGYITDAGPIYVKINNKTGARVMFDGEAASLEALLNTNTIKVPKPIKVFDQAEGGAALVTEYLDMTGLRKHSALLGTQLARLHIHNAELVKLLKCGESSVHRQDLGLNYIGRFGFPVTTCCGYIPQDNTWEDDWPTFYIRHKLQHQLDIIEREYHDSEARTLWSQAQQKIGKLFQSLDIKPSLLHGDLWGGNAADSIDGPVVFDTASFYGHHEFDLGIAKMFGGFSSAFFDAYHKIIPKAPGFDQRNQLYQLFHYLNHWNHFGSGYRSQSIAILKQLSRL